MAPAVGAWRTSSSDSWATPTHAGAMVSTRPQSATASTSGAAASIDANEVAARVIDPRACEGRDDAVITRGPFGSAWACRSMTDHVGCGAATAVDQPGSGARPAHAAMSPPEGSHSATSGVGAGGAIAPSRSAVVVAAAVPGAVHTATMLIQAPPWSARPPVRGTRPTGRARRR